MRRNGTGTTVRSRRRPAALSAIGVLVVTVWLSACDGPADHASSTLTQLAAVKVLSETPPGGIVLGKGKDQGSDFSITGRDPGLTTVFAAPGTVADTAVYYRTTYPQYKLVENCCASAEQTDLGGVDGWAGIDIQITRGKPDLAPHFNIKLARNPAADQTYVVVYVTGQPPTRPAGQS